MKEISVEELKQWQDSQKDFQLIDVREDAEYEVSNLGGLHIPLAQVPEQLDKVRKDIPVVVHCRSGKRSANAISYLEQQGYTNLSNLAGGILAWKANIDPSMDVY